MLNSFKELFSKSPILIGLFLLIGLFISTQSFSSQQTIDPNHFLNFDSDPIQGPNDARFVFIEYADYQCLYCKEFHQTLSKWFSASHQKKLNSGQQVNWVFRHFPVLGTKSTVKAKTAICVLEQLGNEAFWQFNDLLFTQPVKPSNRLNYQQSLWLMASKQNWDVDLLIQCDNEQNHQTKLESLANQSKALNLSATPSWFLLDSVTGKVIVGNGNLSILQLDQLLLQQTTPL